MVRGSLEQEAFLPSFLSSGSLRPRRRSCEAIPRNRSWHQLCQDTQCNRWNRGDWWDSEKVFFSENIVTGFHHRSSWIWKINHWQHDCRFLGPRGPLRVPLMSARLSVRPSVRPQQTFQLMEIHYKSLHQTYQIIYFLKAHDPHNPLTLRDDKYNDKYTHKYTYTQIDKF